PFLHCFSPSVVERPKAWDPLVTITGYWFLNEKPETIRNKTPEDEIPQGLEQFIHRAWGNRKKIVYIGFGSVIVEDLPKMTKTIVKAVSDAEVYAVVSAGWSGQESKASNEKGPEVVKKNELFTENMFYIKSVLHDWLFPKIDAVVHHGGIGTTAASLRGMYSNNSTSLLQV
ncbi:family 1 glycosyltransferase, partial [Melampsora larici-populina 98AG31]